MKYKTVRLIWDAQFVGRDEITVKIPCYKDDAYIQSLFLELFGVPYDYNCKYIVVEN